MRRFEARLAAVTTTEPSAPVVNNCSRRIVPLRRDPIRVSYVSPSAGKRYRRKTDLPNRSCPAGDIVDRFRSGLRRVGRTLLSAAVGVGVDSKPKINSGLRCSNSKGSCQTNSGKPGTETFHQHQQQRRRTGVSVPHILGFVMLGGCCECISAHGC